MQTVTNNQVEVVQARTIAKDLKEMLFALYGRWLDERQFEDIEEYRKVIQRELDGAKITKMTKRPFGFEFVIGHRKFAISLTSTKYRLISLG